MKCTRIYLTGQAWRAKQVLKNFKSSIIPEKISWKYGLKEKQISYSRAFQYKFARVNFEKSQVWLKVIKVDFSIFLRQIFSIKYFDTIKFFIIWLKVVSKIMHFEIINRFTKVCCRKLAKYIFDCLDDILRSLQRSIFYLCPNRYWLKISLIDSYSSR